MEGLIEKLENKFQQKIEVHYGDNVIVKSSPSNPPESEKLYLVFGDINQALRTLKIIVSITDEIQKETNSYGILPCDDKERREL